MKVVILTILVSLMVCASLFAVPTTKPARNDPPLVAAADSGDLEAVRKILDSGEKPDENPGGSGTTALMRAAFHGHIEVMKLLIERGASPTARLNGDGDNVLIFATDGGEVEAVKLLLEKGADVNYTNNLGFSVLHHAIMFGGGNKHHKVGPASLEISKLLIEKGADVNASAGEGDVGGYTPLILAAEKDSKELVELLLAKGAKVNAKTNFGRTALQAARHAAEATHEKVFGEIANILIDHGAKE